MSECSDKGLTKDISAPKPPKFVDHAQVLKFYAKAKKCFFCGNNPLKSDCPKYKFIDKATGIEKPPFDKSKVCFQKVINKSVHEISSDLPLGEDVTEINGTFPDAETSDNDEMDIVNMAQQFISVLNLEEIMKMAKMTPQHPLCPITSLLT